MKPARRLIFTALTVSASAAAAPAFAQSVVPRFSGYVTLTTDYRNRGFSQSGGDAALQIGMDYQHPLGFFVGGWASNVEYRSEPPRETERSAELDYYIGYDWRRDDWAATITVGRYTYPGLSGDYDYNEVSGSIGYGERIYFTASFTDDLLSRNLSALNQELRVALPVVWNMELGAALGVFEIDDIPGSRYTHWNAGISKLMPRFILDLRFYDNSYDDNRYVAGNYLGDPSRDQWVFSISYGFPVQ